MVILVAPKLCTAKDLINVYSSKFNIEFTGLELEYGDDVLDSSNSNIAHSFNHHSTIPNDKKMFPCEAFKYMKDKKLEPQSNFLLSHIDLDVIFGIGWLCGCFPLNNPKFIKMAGLIKEADTGALIEDPVLNRLLFFVNRLKKKCVINNSGVANISSLVLICLGKIRSTICKGYTKEEYPLIPTVNKLKQSNDFISVYGKKFNDFYKNGNKFIICKTHGLSVYGQEEYCTKHNINVSSILKEYFGNEAGGTNTAGGSPRKTKLNMVDFKEFILWFKNRVENGVSYE